MAAPPKIRCRLCGLALTTWIVAFAMFASLVWCEFHSYRTVGRFGGRASCYGWPFLAAANLEMAPAKPQRWRLWFAGRAADGFVVVLMTVSTAIAAERWRRQKPGRPQFGLSKLMLLVATISILLGAAINEPPLDPAHQLPRAFRGLHYAVRFGDQPILARACLSVGVACSGWLILAAFSVSLKVALEILAEAFPAGPMPALRRGQFGLRTFFILLTVLAVWVGVVLNRAREQREAIQAIESLGGEVFYDWQLANTSSGVLHLREGEPGGPAWLRRIIGDDLFQHAQAVRFPALSPNMEQPIGKSIPHLRRLHGLKVILLPRFVAGDLEKPTDESLRTLGELKAALPNCGVSFYWNGPLLFGP